LFYLACLASKHVKVVLSGQGADESLGGYGRYQGELYRRFIPAQLIKFSEPIARRAGLKNDQMLRGLKSLWKKNDLERFLCTYSVFDESEIVRLMGKQESKSIERLKYFYDLLQCERLSNSVERMMAIDLRMNLSDDLLLYTDKITMYYSLECRVPMLDHDLVSFIESLPYTYKVRIGKGKRIHKRFAQQVLPDLIINRRKKGFLSPTGRWFSNGGVIRDILLDHSNSVLSFINKHEIKNILLQQEQGYNRERQIFLLLCIAFWMREFN
jgi:asparagine synthase (glutamine-hydrolysing)